MNTETGQSMQGDLSMGRVNVGRVERIASVLGGAALITFGLLRRSRAGWSMAAAGAPMLYRGLRGHCPMYGALGINRASREDTQRGNLGVKVERSVVVEEPAEKIYAFWRDFRNLPTIMRHVESVSVLSPTRSHWVVRGPVGTTFQWDAEIITDRPNELISWRTMPDARVEHAGSVRFEPQAGGATLVRVAMQYNPPGGELAHVVAAILGEDPGKRIEEDLSRLREALGRAQEDRDGLQAASADALGYRPPR
jgi:uncharacterized membrane protein